MAVPYTFGTATASIPLSNLDSNFATTITLGNTAIQLGNTVTTLNNMTLANVTVSSGNVTFTNVSATLANVTTANIGTAVITGTSTLTGLTASTALALDASKNIVSVTNTGTGNNVLATSPTITTPTISSLTSAAATALTLQSAGTTAVTVDTSQNVGIGTTSPIRKLQISASGAVEFVLQDTSQAANSRNWRIYNSSNSLVMGTLNDAGSSGNDYLKIDSGGNVLVGTTNTSPTAGAGMKFIFSVDAANPVVKNVVADGSGAYSTWNLYSTNAGAYRFFVTTAGVINATTVVITAISDQLLKENIRDIDTGLNAILALKPRRFDWKPGKGQDKKNAAGFIAQEFETVFPECVGISMAGEDGIEYKNINHETLIPTLVKAIQEQQTLITSMTARIAALEAK